MPVTLKRQRDGQTWRPGWYGEYVDGGARRVVNLNVPWRGKAPDTLRDTGDKAFEESRRQAEAALASFVDEARRKGRAEHLVERLIESKTGATVEHVRVADLLDRWLSLPRENTLSEGYTVLCKAVLTRFAAFMAEAYPKAVYAYQVTPAAVGEFLNGLRKGFSIRTQAAHLGILRPAFDAFLPKGAANPFRTGLKLQRHRNGDGGSVHRKPFTPDELRKVLDVARPDAFMYPLIVTAACTGMRRADVCGLKWDAVDFKAGMLEVKTEKTGEEVEIPIFKPLLDVLQARQRDSRATGKGKDHVFPQAARMLAENPDGLTYRFKSIVARALDGDATAEPGPEPTPEIEAEGKAAIMAGLPEGERRDRILDTFSRYCAGESMRAICAAARRPKGTVSGDLHAVETFIGRPFIRAQAPGIKERIARVTRADREQGQRAASLYDWHALRTTFITLALSAGVEMELVRRITGHKTVEIVLKHYFRPGREQFKAALTGALPAVLTGESQPEPAPGDELTMLAGKVATGTATDAELKRFKKLAAKL